VADAWLLGPVVPQGVGLVASTYRDCLSLSHGTELSDTGRLVVEEVVRGTATEIDSWVGVRRSSVA